MKARELKLLLFDRLAKDLQPPGFKLQKSRERFLRLVNGAKQSFALSFAVYEELHVKSALAVRFDEVEVIFHRTSGFEKQYHGDTPTLSLYLEAIDSRARAHVLSLPDQVESVAAELRREFFDGALPYFERHTTIESVDRTLNDLPEIDNPSYPMPYLRCAHGLITAKLAGRTNFPALVDTYRRQMAAFASGFYLDRFDALATDLHKD